jgi:uncharacterized integral membrane protein
VAEEEPRQEEQATEQEAPAAETRLRRGLRATHPVRLYVSIVVALATAIYLILLIVQNTRRVTLDYVFGSAETRLIWLIVISALTGWVLGVTTSFFVRRRTRRPR